ncbi:hypothetical protein ABIA69_003921 [Lysinibacillus parviboronicapiens]|uniref:MotA/TolQ/ExbB proton channel domain-containing protein n=1 Tax=Lysinibacillus parviboronicapiens TaxID=436516 RepID=A0ABV2PP52_9BACI
MFQRFIAFFRKIFEKRLIWLIIFIIVLTLHLTKGIFFEELANFLGSYFIIYFSFLFYFWLIILVSIIIVFLKYIIEKMDLFIYSQYKESEGNYYKWLGQDMVSEKFLLELFKEDASRNYDDIENIIKIRELIEKKLKGELVNYKLLKNFLEFRQKNNSFRKINVVLFSLSATFFTFILSSVLKPKIVEYFEKGIKLNLDINLIFTNNNYGNLIVFLGIAIAIYLFIASLFSNLTENKRRTNYLISMLDILIKDKESNQTV